MKFVSEYMTVSTSELPTCIYCKCGDRDFPCRAPDGSLSVESLMKSLAVTCRHGDGTEYEANFWAYECMDKLVQTAPQAAIQAIISGLDHLKTGAELASLAAGPMEDLMIEHGAEVIDLIETEARRNQRFRFLLSGIWGETDTDPDVWRRLQTAVKSGPWIDMDPRTPQGSSKYGDGEK